MIHTNISVFVCFIDFDIIDQEGDAPQQAFVAEVELPEDAELGRGY